MDFNIITFTSGQAIEDRQCTQVVIMNDNVVEYNESFTLLLISQSPAETGEIAKATFFIMEDPKDCTLHWDGNVGY